MKLNAELSTADLKKGMAVFLVTVWNHHFNHVRSLDRGATTIPADVYKIEEVTVHSAGKKQIYLQDANGMRGQMFYAKTYGERCEYAYYYAATREDALQVARELHELDQHATATYQTV